MSKKEMVRKIEELKNLEDLINRAKTQAESIKDEIKAEMIANDTEEMFVENYIVRFTSITTNKFDVSGFKKLYPSMWSEWIRTVNSRRFSIS